MYFISLFISLFFFLSCNGQDKEKEIMKNYQYKTDKRPVYGMDLTVPGPYELYINDIAARKDYGTGMHNTFIEINPYVLKSGTYKFTLKLLPMPSELEKGGIQPSTIDFLKVAISSYEKTGTKKQGESYEKIKIYPISKIKEPVPFYEVKGEFSVNLPYELEGWSKGQNLSKIDKAELEKKVVAFYEKLRNSLNTGNYKLFNESGSQRTSETYVFNYTPSEEIAKFEEENNADLKNCKDRMAPIEDYSLKIYGDGKLVMLERNLRTELYGIEKNIVGLNALIRKGKVKGYKEFPTLLYLPEGSNEFVIIRK
ncbi:hypothetical protein AU378_04470 [Chryseobacterium kwangjuense]|uniref:Uncharacterized protein n=2 Tax=Chryseobacterium kwangjuense TaxID=267125 RepID=A0A135WJB8_9FLAO|nr:hypothetical protein AU378_04470 [Chryseobacterium kwangjuense]